MSAVKIEIDMETCNSCKTCMHACFVDVIRWNKEEKKPIDRGKVEGRSAVKGSTEGELMNKKHEEKRKSLPKKPKPYLIWLDFIVDFDIFDPCRWFGGGNECNITRIRKYWKYGL